MFQSLLCPGHWCTPKNVFFFRLLSTLWFSAPFSCKWEGYLLCKRIDHPCHGCLGRGTGCGQILQPVWILLLHPSLPSLKRNQHQCHPFAAKTHLRNQEFRPLVSLDVILDCLCNFIFWPRRTFIGQLCLREGLLHPLCCCLLQRLCNQAEVWGP